MSNASGKHIAGKHSELWQRQKKSPFTREVLRTAWRLLTDEERFRLRRVMALTLATAFLSMCMVWSVRPFLQVLSDPETVQTNTAIAIVYQLLGAPSIPAFVTILGIFSMLVVAFVSAMQVFHVYVVAQWTTKQTHSFGRRLLECYMARPYEFFLERNSNELSANLLSEAEAAINFFYRPAILFVSSLLTSVALLGLLCAIDLKLALGSALVIGGSYGFSFVFLRNRLRAAGQARSEANHERFTAADEGIKGIKDIRILGHEPIYLDRFDDPARRFQQAEVVRSTLTMVPRHLIQGLVFWLMIIVCLVLVGFDLSSESDAGGQSIATFVPLLGVFAFAGQRLVPELQGLYANLSTMQFGAASLDRLSADLLADDPHHVAQSTKRLQLRETLRFDQVSYAYPGSDRKGLRDIDLSIRASEKIGIIGASGSGKTTLGNLTLGLLRPTQGSISADGVSITEDNLRDWQNSVGFVAQEIFIADASAAENIALGLQRDRIPIERVEACARRANIHDVLVDLPQGYDTPLGEQGIRLSGGQRQRIAIARALYKGAELIVFDEATSALDTATERSIMESVHALPQDTTILIIAHRLSTIDRCDRIAVMENGRLVGLGTSAELQRTCLTYTNLLASASIEGEIGS